MRLSNEQLKHINSLRWLFSENNRGAGKSYLLGCVLIEKAIETDKEISIIDHYQIFGNNRHVTLHMLDQIKNIYETYPELYTNYELNILPHMLSFRMIKKPENYFKKIEWSFE